MYSPYYFRYPDPRPIEQVRPVHPYYQPLNIIHMQQQYPQQWMNYPMNGSIPINQYGMPNVNQFQAQTTHPGFQVQQGIQNSSWLEVFKTEKGQFDVNKVMSTAGQMMSTAQQFGSLVKGIGSIFPKV